MAPIFDGKLPQFFTLVGAPSKQNIGLELPGTLVWEQNIDRPCVKSNNLEDTLSGILRRQHWFAFQIRIKMKDSENPK